MEFKHFFNAYDTTGQQHTGFLQSMDFSALEESVTFLNELTWAFMDAYLYNELSGSIVMRQWGQYMHYSRENERFEVMRTFYQDFVNALAAKLMRAEKWYQLTKIDFTSLSATDIKTIQHGLKETVRDYGEDETTNVYGQQQDTNVYGAKETTQRFGDMEESTTYGQDETTNVYGQQQDTNVYGAKETTQRFGDFEETTIYGEDEKETVYGQKSSQLEHGAQTKTMERAAQTITKDYDAVVVTVERDQDSHTIGAATTETDSTTTNKLYPLGAAAYVDDTQAIVDSETRTTQQINTDTWGDQETSTAARQDTEGHAQYTDVDRTAAYMDATLDLQHTDTETREEHTDIHAIDQHTDVTEEATHTDTVTSATHTDTQTRDERTDVHSIDQHTDVTEEATHTDTATSAAHTDTKTRDARRDTEQIKAYTDQETHVKHIVISPEKYYQITKELADIGVYDLMRDAVKETMLLCVWEGGYIW